MSDRHARSLRFRNRNVIDDSSRECLAAVISTSLAGVPVAQELDRIAEMRGYPCIAVKKNDTDLTSSAIVE